MAEAVFSITAEINPQIDERQLQRQADQLANQLNGILAKKINPVGFNPVSGSFRPFEKEVDKAKGVLDRFRDSASGLPRTLGNVARSGKSAFLKFSDAVNLTRRDMVGFGRGIRDTIRSTNLFEDALDNIKATGSSIADLPQRFEDLAAQVRSGTSFIDRMASGGDRLAQLFQPLQQQGEVARTEFVELNRSIDQLIGVVQELGTATRSTGSIIKEQFGVPLFQQQIKSFEELKTLVASDASLLAKLEGSIQEAFKSGNLSGIHTELTEIIAETERFTGPLGKIKQEINEASGGKLFKEFTVDARALNEELRKGAIDKLREFGGNELLGPFQNLASAFRNIKENVTGAINVFNTLRTALANVLPGQSPIGKLIDSGADAVTFFRVLKAEGVPALQALRQAFNEASTQFKNAAGITSGIQRIKSELAGLGLLISQTKLGAKINESFGKAGDFLNKNLIDPLRKAGPQIKQAFSTIGKDFANGFGVGLDSTKAPMIERVRAFGNTALETLRRVLKTHSDSKETIKMGQDTGKGFAHGVQSTQGIVNKAISGLGEGLKLLGAQVAQFAKSAAIVGGTIFAGLAGSALLAGKEFNVLKQVINSSLPVLVGSKEASADLLVQVNKLNDASPFARSSFLELTRVLAGFGVQAQKITPLIDAIQQTVAATGGSDQDLLELGQAFAKIQSQGRVTGEILQSFSVRGVDAVAILAQGFGKTTVEMRKMISDGLVPANKAIDVLTKGLKEKFDGATDAVAKNFPGALQRVQARLRDIGGSLLTTFINPAGGGALVTFLNNMADSLSHINKELLPKLQPALEVVGDLLVKFSEKVEDVVKGISGDEFGNFVNKLKPLLPLLAGIAGFAPAAFGFIPVIGPIIAGLGGPFTALAAALGVFLVQSGNAKPVVEGLGNAFTTLRDNIGPAANFLKDNFSGALAVATGQAGRVTSVITGTTGAFGGLLKIIPGLKPLGSIFQFIGTAVGKFLSFVIPTVKEGGKLTKVGGGLAKIFPKLAGTLKFLTGPIGLVVQIMATLVLTSQKFRDALVRLFNAVKPVALFIGGVLVVAMKILDEAIKALEPVFVIVVNLIALIFEKLNLVIKPLAAFIKKLNDAKVIEKVFKGIKEGIQKAIEFVVGAINILIKAYNAIPFLDNVKEIKIEFDADVDPLKKAAEDAKKAQDELKKAAEKSAEAVKDNFDAANKAVEVATKNMGDATDQLRQAIDTAFGVINTVVEAAKAAQTASEAVVTARQKEAEAIGDVNKLQTEYATALRDSISPANELGVAERTLTRIRKGLIDLTREEISIGKENKKLQQELIDLQGEEAAEDRADLVRGEERARIALNKARQAEIDLQNELNGSNKVSLDLAGLSLDQIRAKIAAARLSSSKDRKKTAQEIADERTSARLDVEDAEAAVENAKESSAQFEIDNLEKIQETKDKIRDNDERIKEIADDRADQLLEEADQLKTIAKLRAGETTQQQIILDFDEKIRDAKEIQKSAAKDIETATTNSAIAAATFRLKTAEAKGDVDGILKAQQDLLTLQTGDLKFGNEKIRDIMGEQLANVRAARDAAREMTAELAKANKLLGAATALQGAGSSLSTFETLSKSQNDALIAGKGQNPVTQSNIAKAQKAVLDGIRSALASGGAEVKRDQSVYLPDTATVNKIMTAIANQFKLPGKNLRDAIAEALNSFGLSMPGFAAARGLSPGMVHRGMNDGKGLVRMFEFGKEAVLPLTRPTDMKRIVTDPRVLPAVLKAIPGFAKGFAPGNFLGSGIIANALVSPNSALRKLLQDLFNQMGMQFPGFATGYAPGDLGTSGLSSLKSFSLPEFSSSSLSPLLNTLPRWSMPTRNTEVSLAPSASNDLTAVVKSARHGNGPANSDVYEKKSQREFADTIGEAVRVAVKSAIEESGGMVGDDIDIHVNPNASETQRMIAREVKRQLDKRTGKW